MGRAGALSRRERRAQARFPRDHGAHPEFRIEWWYVTGWLDGPLGFQITFFRARPEEESDNPSAFNPRQMLFAHAALATRSAAACSMTSAPRAPGSRSRKPSSTAPASGSTTGGSSSNGNRYDAHIAAREFEFDFSFFANQLVLQGEQGFSRKGHRPHEASYYYSRPHLNVVGKLNGRDVEGTAWLDHEWSSAYMAPEAAGWDWCGINLSTAAR